MDDFHWTIAFGDRDDGNDVLWMRWKMARMVDADALAKAIGVHTYMQTEWTPATAWGVPIVDAEPVVRCNDCKYYIADGCDECELMSAKSIIATIKNKRWYSDFYCAWGERREDGKVD